MVTLTTLTTVNIAYGIELLNHYVAHLKLKIALYVN